MRARRAAMAALLFGTGVLAPVSGSGDSEARLSQAGAEPPGDCRVGGAPTQPYGEHPPEGFLRYGTRPVVIGCAELASGRRFELVGYQLGRGERTELCIDQYDFETGISWGCGSNLVRSGAAIEATSVERTAGHVPVVAGTITPSVARVVVRSEIHGRLRRHAAAVVRVRNRELLRTIDVRKPFGRYLAEVPSGARAASAEARGAHGRTLGLAFFPGFRGPVGEGRACYRRPRVTRLRLLEPARVARTSRLRVVANYRGGSIGSFEVSLGGRPSVRADLAAPPTLSDGGRRVVTLPVRFARRGFVAIDVTAEGLPLSRRCGTTPVPRRSELRTLGVRVR
jgi:hypothetical protein